MNFIQISLTFPLPPHLSLLIRRPTIVSRRRGPRPVERQQILHRANQPTPLQPRGQIAVRLRLATAPAHPRQVLARPRDGQLLKYLKKKTITNYITNYFYAK